jgi:hypothetical protein
MIGKSDFRKSFDDASTALMTGDLETLQDFCAPDCQFHIPGAVRPITDAKMLPQMMQQWQKMFTDFGHHTDDQVEFHDDDERHLTVVQHMNLTRRQQTGQPTARRAADMDTTDAHLTPYTEICHVLERDRKGKITDWRWYFGEGPATQELLSAAMPMGTMGMPEDMRQEDLLTDRPKTGQSGRRTPDQDMPPTEGMHRTQY